MTIDKGRKRCGRGRLRAALLLGASLLLTGCAAKSSGGKLTSAGMAKLESGDYRGALEELSAAVAAGETPAAALRGEGMAYLALGQYSDAIASFDQALAAADEKMPETKRDIRLYRLLACLRNGDYSEVIADAAMLDEEDKASPETAYYQGAAYLALGDQDNARTFFDQAVEMAPADYELCLQIYQLFEAASLSAVGDIYLQKGLSQEPETEKQKLQVGRIYLYLEQYDKAQSIITSSVESGSADAAALLGEIYLAQGDYDHARSTYEKLLTQENNPAAAYNGLALCDMAAGDYDSALEQIQQGLDLDAEESEQQLRFNELVCYEKKLDFVTALAKAELYVQLYPTDENGQREYIFLRNQLQ